MILSKSCRFFQMQGEGIYCLPLNLSATNATGLTNEQNVTIQVRFKLSNRAVN